MARTRAELGLRKWRKNSRSLPYSAERRSSRARAPTPKPLELVPNPLEELPAAPAGMTPEMGNGRGSTSWAPRAVVVVVMAK